MCPYGKGRARGQEGNFPSRRPDIRRAYMARNREPGRRCGALHPHPLHGGNMYSNVVSPLHTCTKAKLFVTGDKDHVYPLPVLQELVARCPEPKALALIPGADHFFLGREAEVAEAVVTFVTQ